MENKLKGKVKIKVGLDVSTTRTGYAILINDKPMFLDKQHKESSIGSIDMTQGEFTSYGNRMGHASLHPVIALKRVFYKAFLTINDLVTRKKITVEKVSFAVESSEIPNYGSRFRIVQNMTTLKKLSLYVGFVLGNIATTISACGFHFWNKVNFKLVNAQEWQRAVEFTKHDRDHSKAQSVARANVLLKKWGFEETQDDDMADAINLATVADIVKDTMEVKRANNFNKHTIGKLQREKNKLLEVVKKLELKALGKQSKKREMAAVEQTKLIQKGMIAKNKKIEKIANAKNSKYKNNLADLRKQDVKEFLTSEQKRRLMKNDPAYVAKQTLDYFLNQQEKTRWNATHKRLREIKVEQQEIRQLKGEKYQKKEKDGDIPHNE